jgi:hypothetical protein
MFITISNALEASKGNSVSAWGLFSFSAMLE